MSETIQAQTNILAVGGIFSSGTDLIWAAMGFLGAVALFMGTVSAIGKVKKEGTGAAITGQIERTENDALLVWQLFRQEHRCVAMCGRDKR